jgi:hypothetical protein
MLIEMWTIKTAFISVDYNTYKHGNVTRKLPVAILNKQTNVSGFFLIQNWRTGGLNRSCLGVWYQWEEGGCGERV